MKKRLLVLCDTCDSRLPMVFGFLDYFTSGFVETTAATWESCSLADGMKKQMRKSGIDLDDYMIISIQDVDAGKYDHVIALSESTVMKIPDHISFEELTIPEIDLEDVSLKKQRKRIRDWCAAFVEKNYDTAAQIPQKYRGKRLQFRK